MMKNGWTFWQGEWEEEVRTTLNYREVRCFTRIINRFILADQRDDSFIFHEKGTYTLDTSQFIHLGMIAPECRAYQRHYKDMFGLLPAADQMFSGR